MVFYAIHPYCNAVLLFRWETLWSQPSNNRCQFYLLIWLAPHFITTLPLLDHQSNSAGYFGEATSSPQFLPLYSSTAYEFTNNHAYQVLTCDRMIPNSIIPFSFFFFFSLGLNKLYSYYIKLYSVIYLSSFSSIFICFICSVIIFWLWFIYFYHYQVVQSVLWRTSSFYNISCI